MLGFQDITVLDLRMQTAEIFLDLKRRNDFPIIPSQMSKYHKKKGDERNSFSSPFKKR